MKFLFCGMVVACAASVGQPVCAAVLYDGSLGTTLSQQGWFYLTDPLSGADAQYSAAGGATRLDSTPTMSDSAGFFTRLEYLGIVLVHPAMPVLDPQAGYTLQFSVAVPTETHVSTHRAGFSVLVVGEDYGSIELGFWTNEIWAQSGPNPLDPGEALFARAERSGAFDTTTLTSYELRVLGDGYSLWSDSTELLSGLLRDYSSHSHPVYSMPNTIFVGDDTGSASTLADVHYVAVTTGVVPEPSAWLLLIGIGVVGCLARRRRGG